MENENVTVRTEVDNQVDEDVRARADSIAMELTKHVNGLPVDGVDLCVLFEQFQLQGERGSASIRLKGTINGQNVDSKHEWVAVPQRGSIGGKIIASAVSNTMHGGGDGIRQTTIDNVLSASTATFCANIDDAIGIETSSVRAGMKSAWRWALIGFGVGLVAVLFGSYQLHLKDKNGNFANSIIPTLVFGSMFAAIPATAAGSLRMLFIPGKEIENSPYGTNLMNVVGLKSGNGVKAVFAGFLLGAIALTTVIIVSFSREL